VGISYVGPAPSDPTDLTPKSYVDGVVSTTKNTYTAVSSTSNTVATGSKTFAITGVGGTPNFVVGQLLRVYNTSTPATYVQGLVTAASTTSVTINATEVVGSGTVATWTLVIAGVTGTQGSTGTTLTNTSTSATSVAVGTGSKTFAITGVGGTPSYAVGQVVRAYNTGVPTNYMQGLVTAASTSSLTINVTDIGGSGTIAAWTLVVSAVGVQGATGPANTLTIGTVTTGTPGGAAAASVTGTAPNQSLNLTLPAGANGTNATTYTLTATSTTTNGILIGSVTFAITGVGGVPNFTVGQLVRAYDNTLPGNYVQGLVTASTATSLTINATETGGSGTSSSWTIAPSGATNTRVYLLGPNDPDPTASAGSPSGFYFRMTS